jgi:hypothetical protein
MIDKITEQAIIDVHDEEMPKYVSGFDELGHLLINGVTVTGGYKSVHY